jgi:hypothetical protein
MTTKRRDRVQIPSKQTVSRLLIVSFRIGGRTVTCNISNSERNRRKPEVLEDGDAAPIESRETWLGSRRRPALRPP